MSVAKDYTKSEVLQKLRRQVALHGQKNIAESIGISQSFLCDVMKGRRAPTGELLVWLGFRGETVYRKLRREGSSLKAIERYDCTNGGAQFCQGCYTMTRDDDGDWMRYDAELVRDALRYRTLRILPSNRVIVLAGMAPDEIDRVLDRIAAIYAQNGAIDTAIAQADGGEG